MGSPDKSPSSPPAIPGYRVHRFLGRGASSTVWLAEKDHGPGHGAGSRFAIKCIAVPEKDAGNVPMVDGASREVAVMSSLRHGHLLRVHDVVQFSGYGSDGVGLVLDYAAGGSLAALVAIRGSLGIGEAVTVLVPLAHALSYLHGEGTVHGDISPGNVLFTSHGKPLLADLGTASLLGEVQDSHPAGTEGFADSFSTGRAGRRILQPARDVYSLAALGWFCLTGHAPEPGPERPPLPLLVPGVPSGLAAALEAGLDPDPKARPTAKEFGTAVHRSAAAHPVDLAGAVHPSVIPELLTRRRDADTRRRRLPWRRKRATPLVWESDVTSSGNLRAAGRRSSGKGVRGGIIKAGTIGVAGLALLAAGAYLWPNGSPSQQTPDATAVSTGERSAVPVAGTTPFSHDLPADLAQALKATEPEAALPALSRVRDLALREGRPELLALVNGPGSPAEAADKDLSGHLASQGIRLGGLSTEVANVSLRSKDGNSAEVELTATTSDYEERDAAGRVMHRQPAGKPQDLRLVLKRTEGAWRIVEILASDQ